MQESLSIFLKFTEVTILPYQNCTNIFGKNVASNKILCTDTSSLGGPCKGDSGSALAITNIDSPLLIGIFSLYNKAGCQLGSPVVYAKISSHLNWIRLHTGIDISD